MNALLEIRAAQFQAAWYFTLLLAVILLLVVVGSGYALAGARSLWREGEHGPALALGGAVIFGLVAMIGMYAAGIGGVFAVHGGS